MVAWGYHRNTTKGSRLLRLLREGEHTVHDDFSEYTRFENSVALRQVSIQWSLTQQYFGSDNAIIQAIIQATPKRLK